MVFQQIIKSRQNIVMTTCLILLLLIEIGNAGTSRKINCRKYVHAPECRGIAAKRDTRFLEEYRLAPPTNEFEEKSFKEKSFLNEFLRRLAEREIDYDPDIYVK